MYKPLQRLSLLALLLAGTALQATVLDLQKDFNAVGDGKADDTAALQQAFSSGKEVFIPLGEYRFTETIRATARTKIKGVSGSWNPIGQTVLRYDGPEGQIALSVENAHNFQMRHVTVDGSEKASISVYWNYSTNDAMLEDVGIRGAIEHGLYITNTWYAHFNRIHVRRNLGAGLTLDRDHFKAYAKGPVNYVNFNQSVFHSNGTSDQYNGEDVVDVGYGVGSFGANAVINFIGCAMERNGGSGVYLGGHPTTVLFQGCYIEHNSASLYRKLQDQYGGAPFHWRTIKDREPAGRMASIIDETLDGRGPIVFDNVYVNPQNGIWMKGPGGKFPLVLRGMWHPIVYWSENANWVAYDSSWAPFSSRPGIIYRPTAGELASTSRITFFDPVPGGSGHPAYTVKEGVRRLAPQLRSGLDLYVNTASKDKSGDGRSAETAYPSLQKALGMISNTQLDQEIRIHLSGKTDESLSLGAINGTGRILLNLENGELTTPLQIGDIAVPLTIRKGTVAAPIVLSQARQVLFDGVAFRGGSAPLVRAQGSTLRLQDSTNSGNASVVRVTADWASTVSLAPEAASRIFRIEKD